MSEEITEALVTHEKLELTSWDTRKISPEKSVSPSHLRSTHRRASIGGSSHAGNKATRSFNGKSNSSDSIHKANSRYLRASTGSCHDFCKFGHRSSSQEKGGGLVPIYRRHSKPLPVKVNPMETIALEERKKVKVLNNKPPSNIKTQLPPPYTKSELPKPKTSLDKEKAIKRRPSTDSSNDHQKPKTSSAVKTAIRRPISAPLPKNNSPSAKEVSSPDPPETIKSMTYPSENAKAKVKRGQTSTSEILRFGRQKASPSVKSNPVKVRSVVSSEKYNDVHGAKSRNTKRLAPPASSLIPKASLTKAGSNRTVKAGNSKPVFPPKVQNRVSGDKGNTSNDEKLFEKTMHVVKTESENSVFDSLLDDNVIPAFPYPSVLSDEEDNKEIDHSDKSLEIGKVLSIPDDDTVSSLHESPNSVSRAESSSSLCPHEEVNTEIGSDKSIESGEMLSVHHVHVVSSFPSSPKSLSQAASTLPCVEDEEEIKKLFGRLDEAAFINDKFLVNDGMDSVGDYLNVPHEYISENDVPSAIRNTTQSILEDTKEIEYILKNDESPEINSQSISEDMKEIVYCEDGRISENDEFPDIGISQSSPEDNKDCKDGCVSENNRSPETGILQSMHEDTKGVEHRDNGYTFENDELQRNGIFHFIPEDKKEIDELKNGYISENDESLGIANTDSVPDARTIPSSPKFNADSSISSYEDDENVKYYAHTIPSSPKSNADSSFSSYEDDENVEYTDSELDESEREENPKSNAVRRIDVEYTDSEPDECNTKRDENPTSNTVRRKGVDISNDNHSSPVKLKFRPGRTINLESENTGPRRLRFRRRRVVETESINGETKSSLKKSGGVNNAGGNETSSERVVLKHQDVQDKKDSQVLLNNVIEETASKLVESRKSKVKALVGAFETVISLQETKP